MKKLKNIIALLVLLFSGSVKAQTDVTNTYLTNADFSQGTPISVGICAFTRDMENLGIDCSHLADVEGWTAVNSIDGTAGGLFALGSGTWLAGTNFIVPTMDSEGNNSGNVLGIVSCWGVPAQYTQQLRTPLPANTYTLVLAVYNSGSGQNAIESNMIGFIEDGGTTHYATTMVYKSNEWKYEFITFTLTKETQGTVSIGLNSPESSSSVLPHLFVSGLRLFEGEIDIEDYVAIPQITFTAQNGTITAKAGSTAITSGAAVAQGTTLTFTITPSQGYALSSLTTQQFIFGEDFQAPT